MGKPPTKRNRWIYRQHMDNTLTEVVLPIDRETRGQPAHLVYELPTPHRARRLPGIVVDDEAIRTAAGITIGMSPI